MSESRNAYIVEQVGKRGDVKDSLDEKIYSAVRKQAKSKGLIYENGAARY
ncbi:MAG: VWA domain-containing protein, partial [Gammaproteobacteria bacterium]